MIKRLAILGILALACGAGARFISVPGSAVAVADSASPDAADGKAAPPLLAADEGPVRWREVWTRSAPKLRHLSVSTGGKSVAWVDEKGSIRRVDGASGRVVYQSAPLAGVNRLAAAANGTVLAYSYLNPAAPSVRVLHPRWGEKHARKFSVDGAIWDAALSPAGDRALAATGEHFVYLLSLAPKDPNAPQESANASALARWKSLGIPDSVALTGTTDDASLALLATRQENGVAVWSLDGTPRWRYEEQEIDRAFEVHLSADSSTAVAISWRGPHREDARIDVWDAPTGRLLWRKNLEAFAPRALVSRTGDFIAVSYSRVTHYRTGDVVERKLALFARKGHRMFPDKGSTLFSPELAALSPDGQRLTVRDGASTLYMLDARGRFLSKLRFPVDPKTRVAPTIKEVVPSPDGTHLLIHRGDGQIGLYRAAGISGGSDTI